MQFWLQSVLSHKPDSQAKLLGLMPAKLEDLAAFSGTAWSKTLSSSCGLEIVLTPPTAMVPNQGYSSRASPLDTWP